jgi:feruloyl esterase
VPGGETGFIGWEMWISGTGPGASAMNAIAGQFFKSMIFADQSWDVRKLNVERDVRLAEKLAHVLNATDPDLSALRARGGKLIVYHGWSDAAIAPQNAIDYFESVVAKMGRPSAESFLRLYMVPGLQHCALGPGPNNFGQVIGCAPCDAQHDIYEALERWVEHGEPPFAIVATKFENDFVPTKVARTRPLCPYPGVARYTGTGSTDDAANYACEAPKR